jgi:hypothetical protein
LQCVSLAAHPLSLLSPSFVKGTEENRNKKRKRKEVGAKTLRMLSHTAYRSVSEHTAHEVLFREMASMNY